MGWNDWDDEDEESEEPDTPERRALRDEALARATRDVRLVKTLHLTMVAIAAIVLALAAWIKLG